MARSFINNKEMMINKVELVKEASDYKNITGAVIGKDKSAFYVKTKDNFVKIVEYKYDGHIKIGDRFEVK